MRPWQALIERLFLTFFQGVHFSKPAHFIWRHISGFHDLFDWWQSTVLSSKGEGI
jgi:hypothetical protein